jgi:peptidoglycan/xylan/chitin deacetylase (PgdA/CDA1 family)
MLPEQLKEAYADGLDIQLHTHNHTMHDMSPMAVTKEIKENRHYLSQLLGTPHETFNHFCYPSGCYTSDLEEVMCENGVVSSTTVEQAIAYPDTNRQFLPRILDGEQLTPLELEAELCGVMDLLRSIKNEIVPGGNA